MFSMCSSVLDAEEGEHHEKGPSKVLKKVKEKAKKIKNVLTKHGHSSHEHDRGEHIPDDHDLDQEDDGDNYGDQQIHGGAPGMFHFKSFNSQTTVVNVLVITVSLIGLGSTRKGSHSGEG